MGMVGLRVRTPVGDEEISALFVAGWPGHRNAGFAQVHERSLTWISAWRGERLVGYVNVATDGGIHAFVLDTTVHPGERRHGLGQRLAPAGVGPRRARAAGDEARAAGIKWLHVDYEPHLAGFYRSCGFAPTAAGLLSLGWLGDWGWGVCRGGWVSVVGAGGVG